MRSSPDAWAVVPRQAPRRLPEVFMLDDAGLRFDNEGERQDMPDGLNVSKDRLQFRIVVPWAYTLAMS